MKTPYDINEAKRWFDRSEKAARQAIKKAAAGDEKEVVKARRERDKMSELLRWFYFDDRPYHDAAAARLRVIEKDIVEADELGRAARNAARDDEARRLKREEQDQDAHLDPATRQYRRELGRLREAPRAGNPTTKPGKHGTLYLYRITYKDANDQGAPEFTTDRWAYSLEHIDDITQDWPEDGWEVVSVARVPADGGSMHRAIKHRTHESGRVVAESNRPFERGFAEAVRMWKSGTTWESISHDPRYDASPFGRGMFAAIEAMSGWHDVAEREALAHGLTREEARRLVDSLKDPSSPNRLREARVVADFNTLPDLISHAGRELGATHVSGSEASTKIYFPRGGQYPYEEATVWRKNGYWHAQGPGARTGVERLPAGAKPIAGGQRRAAETNGDPRARFARPIQRGPSAPRQHQRTAKHDFRIDQDVEMISNPTNTGLVVGFDPDGSVMVQWSGSRVITGVSPKNLRIIGRGYAGPRVREDYIAVDRHGRTTAGPFKHYSDAKDAAGPADVVQYVPARRGASEARHGVSTITYIRAGQVERGGARGYVWHDGYSENGNTYPWLTKREAQQDAKRRGARAVFVENGGGGTVSETGETRRVAEPNDAKDVLEGLGPYLEHDGKDAPRVAARIAGMISSAGRSARKAEEVLEHVNKLIGGHGVEAIRDEHAGFDRYSGDVVATYVNMGDTYDTTLLYDTRENEFHVTSWGDWYEAYEQRREAEREEESSEESDEGEEVDESRRVHEAGSNLVPFSSWPEVLAYARTGGPLYYHAPLNVNPVRFLPGKNQTLRYEARARTIKMWPYGSVGRGRNRNADPFTADAGHLERFSRPAKTTVDVHEQGRLLPLTDSDEASGEAYASDQLASDNFRDWVHGQLVEGAKLPPDQRIDDVRQIAKNMLQDMEHDIRREVSGSREFFNGLREKLRSKETVDWLAEEIATMQAQIVEPQTPPAPKAKRKGRRGPKEKRPAKRKQR